MGKRKLTKKQTQRIHRGQEKRSAQAAAQDVSIEANTIEPNIKENLKKEHLGPEQKGLVIAHYGKQLEIEAIPSPNSTGPSYRKRCHFRTNLGSLVAGDYVTWCDASSYGVVVAVEKRLSELGRPDNYGGIKVIAANIDRILIVIAPIPHPHPQLIDRYLVAAETLGITPVLVINKSDLINTKNQELMEKLTALYQSLNYAVISVSTKTGEGLKCLANALVMHKSVFVGQSGVGKSSLIDMLIPNINVQVGAISVANQKGTHTTTTAQLFHFPSGGHLIDSPGIREFGLWHMSKQEIIEGFIEFRPFIGRCKFRDCQHKNEPGCSIRQAHSDGYISSYRMSSFEALTNCKKSH